MIPSVEVSILIETVDKGDFFDIRGKLSGYYYCAGCEEGELDGYDGKLEGWVGEFIKISDR